MQVNMIEKARQGRVQALATKREFRQKKLKLIVALGNSRALFPQQDRAVTPIRQLGHNSKNIFAAA